MGLRLSAGAIVLGVLAIAQPARAQGDFQIRYDADGTMSIVNRVSGRSATVAREPMRGADASSVGAPHVAESAADYDALISEHARLNNVRPDLIRAVVTVESGFNPRARSPRGALGLMQLMPATARQFNVTNPFDPAQNIRAGASYLRLLLDRYDGNEELALAAYNAGPGAVDRYGQTVPPYRETKNYVDRVSEIAGDDDKPAAVVGGSTKFYKMVDIIDGRETITYTTTKPN